MDKIITAKDYCQRDRVGSVKERIVKLVGVFNRKRNIAMRVQVDKLSQRSVYARIELGQWCADCNCGGTEFVDPDEPIFFCFSCGNRTDNGAMRPVIFPPVEERKEIERLVLERPVDDARGLDDMERAHMAKAVIYIERDGKMLPLTRTWNPGEPISNLVAENEAVEKWRVAAIKQQGGE